MSEGQRLRLVALIHLLACEHSFTTHHHLSRQTTLSHHSHSSPWSLVNQSPPPCVVVVVGLFEQLLALLLGVCVFVCVRGVGVLGWWWWWGGGGLCVCGSGSQCFFTAARLVGLVRKHIHSLRYIFLFSFHVSPFFFGGCWWWWCAAKIDRQED